jgi:TetR/AcrR family transcriptional repressor of nem operon
MSRSSRADAEKHRAEVVSAAARLFRERGIAPVGIPELMSAAGLTHGAFYRQFASKDELTGIAANAAFDEHLAMLARINARNASKSDARAELLDEYFDAAHRDAPGTGCANTGLAADSARAPADGPLRASYTRGAKKMLEQLADLDDPALPREERESRAIFTLAAMVGAMTMARATAGDPLSDSFLSTVHERLARMLAPHTHDADD